MEVYLSEIITQVRKQSNASQIRNRYTYLSIFCPKMIKFPQAFGWRAIKGQKEEMGNYESNNTKANIWETMADQSCFGRLLNQSQ